jgi:hypothetical protein
MKSKALSGLVCLLLTFSTLAQRTSDIDTLSPAYVTLTAVVLRSGINIPVFLNKVRNDTSFYKAFKNLRVLQFRSENDIRFFDKKNQTVAASHSLTRQRRVGQCRFSEWIDERVLGDYYQSDSSLTYYTAELFTSLFYSKSPICGESNIIGNRLVATSGKRGIEKHKDMLKMLFFNPGKRISGIPFMGNKTAMLDEEKISHYDMVLQEDTLDGKSYLLFQQTVKPGHEDAVVVDRMNTWFTYDTYQIVNREYSLSYRAGVYDFDVTMRVRLMPWKSLWVPATIYYQGNWKVAFKKRERAAFFIRFSDYEE